MNLNKFIAAAVMTFSVAGAAGAADFSNISSADLASMQKTALKAAMKNPTRENVQLYTKTNDELIKREKQFSAAALQAAVGMTFETKNNDGTAGTKTFQYDALK